LGNLYEHHYQLHDYHYQVDEHHDWSSFPGATSAVSYTAIDDRLATICHRDVLYHYLEFAAGSALLGHEEPRLVHAHHAHRGIAKVAPFRRVRALVRVHRRPMQCPNCRCVRLLDSFAIQNVFSGPCCLIGPSRPRSDLSTDVLPMVRLFGSTASVVQEVTGNHFHAACWPAAVALVRAFERSAFLAEC
jgi:hypothetical protein